MELYLSEISRGNKIKLKYLYVCKYEAPSGFEELHKAPYTERALYRHIFWSFY